MKTSFTYKLFFAILITVVFAVVLVSTATRISFTHGFLGYVNDLAVEHMEMVRARAEQIYSEHGNWDFIRKDEHVWFYLLRSTAEQKAHEEHMPNSSIPASDLTGAFLRMGLIDAQHQWVAGYRNINDSMLKRPIQVNGQTVGWIVLASFQSVTGTGNERFQQDQNRTILLASLIAVVLAGLIAYWLARALLAPMKNVTHATHQLAAGHYETRVSVSSRDEIRQLASDFNHLARTLQRNEHVRRNFMAEISHELRTPLAILRGEIDAMSDGIREITPKALASLQAEVAMLSQLVDDLYDLSLSDAGALTYRFQQLDLCPILGLCIDSAQARLSSQEVRLRVHMPECAILINGDEARLQQLFHNLLENSLRYTHQGGSIEITARIAANHITIDWQDSDPGVSDALLPHLFERFFRGVNTSWPGNRGAGLGLAICRNIVEAHGGTVDAKHSPLGGLWIAITFPSL